MASWPTEQLLAAIAQAAPRECITEARLVEITGFPAKRVENSCLKLRKHGLLKKTEQGCHKLTKAGRAATAEGARLRSGPKGPRSGHLVRACTLRCRAWAAMRIKGKFSIDELVMLSIDGGERNPQSNIGKYVRTLARAGYLRPLPARGAGTAPTSNGFVRYLLIRNTGPEAPTCSTSRGTLYDPNTEEDVSLAAKLPRVVPRRQPKEAPCG